MANGGQIRYNVGFNIDKTGLNELTKILQNVQTELAKSGSMGKTEAEIQKTITAAKQLEGVLNSAWNSKLNQLDLSKVSSGIKSTFGSVQQLKAQMEASGSSGAAAYNKVASAVLNTNLQLKQSNKLLDNMATTMANTVKWGITSSIFNKITGSIQEAWGYTKRLDSSLNDIRIVTDKSAESMQKFARQANEAAKALGKGTVDYTDASLIYYQQGLSDEEVAARAEVTLKAANVTGQSTEEVSEQLTAVWNGYKVSTQEAELYVDKLAAVAASTAADLEELSTGMSKVASAANSMGVDIDQLNAQLATIVSVTRQAPESVGTALKTIYARLGDLAIDGEDEFGVTLGTVSKQMEEMGIQILDEQGQMRDMGEVIEETAAKWNTWSDAQRQAAAVAMAGKRQYNNLIALFDNWDMYTESLNTSVDATGTLQKQQEIYMESMKAHLEQMAAEAERTYDVLFNEESIKGFTKGITSTLEIFNDFIEGIGGGGNAFIYLGTIVTNVFNRQIGTAISKQIENLKSWKSNIEGLKLKEAIAATFTGQGNNTSIDTLKKSIEQTYKAQGQGVVSDSALQKEAEIAQKILAVKKALTSEEYNELTAIQKQIGLNEQKALQLESYSQIFKEIFGVEKQSQVEIELYFRNIQNHLREIEEDSENVINTLNLLENADANSTDEAQENQILNSTAETVRQINDLLIQQDLLRDENVNSTQGQLLNEQQILKLQELSKKLDEEELTLAERKKIAEEALKELLNAQNTLAATERQELARVTEAERNRQLVAQGVSNEYREQNQELTKQVNQVVGVKKQTLAFSQGAQALTGLTQGLTAVVGSIGVFFNEASTGAEKANAACSGVSGAASGIAHMIAPGSGILVQGILALGKGILEVTGAWDAFENALKSSTEKLQEATKEFQETLSEIDKLNSSIETNTERIKELYKLKSLGSASLVEEEELENLQIENSLLEAQLALKRQLIAAEQIKIANTAKEAAEEDAYNIDSLHNKPNAAYVTGGYKYNDYEYYLPDSINMQSVEAWDEESYTKYVEEMTKLIEKARTDAAAHAGEGADWNPFTENVSEWLDIGVDTLEEQLKNTTERWEAANKVAMEDISTAYEEAMNVLPSLYVQDNDVLYGDTIKYFEEKVLEYYKATGVLENTVSQAMSSVLDSQNQMDEIVANAENILNDSSQEINEDFLINLIGEEKFALLEQWAQKLGLSLYDLVTASTLADVQIKTLAETTQEPTLTAFDTLKQKIENVKNVLNSIYQNEELSDEQLDFLEKLGKEYEYLGKIQDKNSYDYIRALEEIRELEETNIIKALEKERESNKTKIEEYQNQIKNLEEQRAKAGNAGHYYAVEGYSNAIKDLQDEIQNWMKEIENENYQIEVSITADMKSDIEGAFGLADEFEELRGMITDDLKISFDEAQEFIEKGYGSILTNAEETNEGVIKLNAQAVQAFIISKKKELETDRDTKIQELENQKAILQSQIDALAEEQKYLELATHAKDETEAKSRLTQAMQAEAAYQAQVELMNEEISKDSEQKVELEGNAQRFYEALSGIYATDSENAQAADKAADETTKQYQKNVIDYYARMHAAATSYAKAVKAASSGNIPESYTGSATEGTAINISAPDIQAVNSTYSEDFKELSVNDLFEDLELDFEDAKAVAQQMMADNTEKIKNLKNSIGSIDSAIAALRTSGLSLDQTYEDVGKITEETNEENKDFADELEKIYDRYYDINIQLDLLDTNLSRIQKRQEKLTGKAYIQNLQQQLDILNKQIEANRTKLSLTETEMAEVMTMLSSKGAQFNEAGQVTNYEAIINQELEKANKAIDDYNKLTAEEQKANKAAMESAVDTYNAVVSAFERFDELYTEEIPGLVDTIQETLDQAVELKIEQFNTEVQITLDLKQAEREWNEFQANVLRGLKDDDLVGQANLGMTQWDTYYGKNGTNTISTDIAKLEELNNQASQMLGGNFGTIYGDNFAKLYEDMQAATQQLMTDMEAAQEVADGIYNNYLESIDKVIEGNDAVAEQYEYINGLLDHNVKLIELLGANEKSSMLAEQYAQRNALNQQMVADHYANVQYYEEMMNSIDDKTSEEWQKWHDAWQSEVESLNSSIITAMEDAAEAYTNAIDVAMQEMESAFTDGMGFDYIQDEWDLVNENADKYLDTINAAYEISSLENKFAEAINGTDSLSAQKKLRAAMEEELKLLEEADQISQYDIDRANLKYELTLKQIALEEAQNNKSTMKLKRDSQGNFSYVFAADQDEIAKAQQELADAENELYNFDKDAYREKTEAILKAEQDLQSKLQDIWTNENLSEEQKLQYSEMINKHYRDIIEADISESEKAKQYLSDDTLQIIMKNYQKELKEAQKTAISEEEATKKAVEEMQRQFKGLVDESNPMSTLGTLTQLAKTWGDGSDYTTLTGSMRYGAEQLIFNMQMAFDTGLTQISARIGGEDENSFVKVMQRAMTSCQEASNAYGNTLASIAKSTGINLGILTTGTNNLILSNANLRNILNELISKNDAYIKKVVGEEGTLTAALNLASAYKNQYTEVSNINASMATYLKYLDSMKTKAQAAASAARDLANAVKTQTSAQNNAGGGASGVGQASATNTAKANSGGGSSSPAPAPAPAKQPDRTDEIFNLINRGKVGNGQDRINNLKAMGYSEEEIKKGQRAINIAYRGYDTGGYTGDWGSSEGKLAVLHEKEIVLNKADTKNMLDIVSMVRDMTSSSLRGANGMMSGMIEALATVTNNSNNNTSQNIHITAEFPNVRVASEIEEAFNNLGNIASQYAFSG